MSTKLKTETIIVGKQITTDFKPQKKSYTAPKVEEQFTDDDGEVIYVLENGNTIPKIKYDQMWNVPKGAMIHDKKWKGDNPDRTKEWRR